MKKQIVLTPEQVEKNKIVFFKTDEKYGIFTPELAEFLNTSIFTAPASSNLDMNNCFEGGLLDHIIRVTTYANKINNLLPESQKQDTASLVKVCFLCQIGKCFLFNDNQSQWHKDNLGKMYEFNQDLIAMRIGERSINYAVKNGVKLTDEEYQAIISHETSENNEMYRWHSEILSEILRIAIKLSVLEEKHTWEQLQTQGAF